MLSKEMQIMGAMNGELAQAGVQTGLAIASGPAQSQVVMNCSLAPACTRFMSLLHRSHPEHALASKCSSYMRDTSFLSAGHDKLYKSLFPGSTGGGLPGTLACAIACVQGLPASHKVDVLQTGKKKKKKKHSGKINTEKPEADTHTAAAALDVTSSMPAFKPTAQLKVCTLLPNADIVCILECRQIPIVVLLVIYMLGSCHWFAGQRHAVSSKDSICNESLTSSLEVCMPQTLSLQLVIQHLSSWGTVGMVVISSVAQRQKQ